MLISELKETKERFSLITKESAKKVDMINNSLYVGALKYFISNDFTWIEVPNMTKITGACENVDTLYEVDHFGTPAYLAQTGQLYLEAKIPLHEKLWTIITSSRAEAAVDSRHLNQFQLLEMEFKGDLQLLIKHIEGAVKAMIVQALTTQKNLLKELGRFDEVLRWVKNPFGQITYTEAVDMLKGTENEVKWGDDLKAEQESFISNKFGKPLFITHYPKEIKFFNMKVNPANPEVVNSTDLIMPYSGESTGAAERENNYELLVERLVTSNMFKMLSERGKTLDDFKDYLDIVKKYPILHSGCGIGFNRISQAVLGVDDIRITTNYPIQSNTLY